MLSYKSCSRWETVLIVFYLLLLCAFSIFYTCTINTYVDYFLVLAVYSDCRCLTSSRRCTKTEQLISKLAVDMFGIWPHYLLWLCILMLLSFWQTSYKGLCHYWLCEPDTGRSNHREQTEWIIMLHCTSYSSSKSYGLNFEDKFLGWFVFFNEWINLKVFDRNVRNKITKVTLQLIRTQYWVYVCDSATIKIAWNV
jgi:hypothetical protein